MTVKSAPSLVASSPGTTAIWECRFAGVPEQQERGLGPLFVAAYPQRIGAPRTRGDVLERQPRLADRVDWIVEPRQDVVARPP
jgi:hypothetical protein